MSSLSRRLVRSAVWVTGLALFGSGLVMTDVVWMDRARLVDDALLASARAFGNIHWRVEHGRSVVEEVVLVEDLDTLPDDWVRSALAYERPVYYDVESERVLVLPVETDVGRGRPQEVHAVVVARAERVTAWNTAAPFLLRWNAVSLIVVGIAAAVHARRVSVEIAPLLDATEAARRVVGEGVGARVPAEGPDEVRGLLDSVNALLERRDRAFDAQASFTAEAAHELRTPVTAIIGELDVALRRPRDADAYVQVLRAVRDDAIRLAELVEALMLLARVDAGAVEQGRRLVSAREIVDEAVHREAMSLSAAGCTLEVVPVADAPVDVNPPMLVAALSNLLRNVAVHAPGRAVSVSIDPRPDRTAWRVLDGGPGIDVTRRAAVFERFSSARAARAAGGGLGLGLPLCREIARRHGGDCEVVDGGVSLWVPTRRSGAVDQVGDT